MTNQININLRSACFQKKKKNLRSAENIRMDVIFLGENKRNDSLRKSSLQNINYLLNNCVYMR